MNAGDVIRINTGNGGGYGPPAGRDPELTGDDARNGFPVAFLPEKTYVADSKTRRRA